jgi:type II secretory pathway predicted ATPase ExeA
MYTQFYNFSERPFNLTPDPKFLYLTPFHREALAAMLYGINERKGFISITGEVGTGKTTLIYSFLKQSSEKVKTVFIFHSNITFEQLLENILLELGLPTLGGGKSAQLRLLNEYLIEILSRDENLAIIIDEAQNLSKEVLEELRMLSNLETPKSKLVQILLVGQPELEVKLDSEDLRQLKQRIGIRRHINPLNHEERVEYIDHRLNLVGSNTSRIFTSAAVSLICDYSKGTPRTINILCDNALLIGYGLSLKRLDADIIREVIEDMNPALSRIGFKSKSVQDEVSQQKVPQQKVPQQTRHINPYTLDDKKSTIFNKVPFALLLLLCLFVLGFVGGGNFDRAIGAWRSIFAGNSLSSKILPSEVQTNPLSDSVAQLPPNEHKPLDAVIISSSNLFPGETKTDAMTTSDVQMLPNGNSALNTGTNSSSNLSPEKLKTDAESSNNLQTSMSESKQKAWDDSKAKGKIKGVVVAKKKDCIFSLAQKYYHVTNETFADIILQSNPEIANIHLIDVDQQIKIPEITEESPIIQLPNHTYKIHLGTFSSRISAETYNDEPSLKGKRLEIIQLRVSPGETWYRVVAGKFDDKDTCLKVIGILKEKGLLPIFEEKQNIRRLRKVSLKP